MAAKALIIADDLTGAADTGLQFRNQGFSVHVSLTARIPEADIGADVHVLSTETRNSSRSAVKGTLHALAGQIFLNLRTSESWYSLPLLYKKIDSTLRGWIGTEIKALLDYLPSYTAWIVPAYPKQGRCMERGFYTIHGKPLHETEFVAQIVGGCGDSQVLPLLERQMGTTLGLIECSTLAEGPEAIRAAVRRAHRQGRRAILFDAGTDEHLHRIAEAGKRSDRGILWVGSAGLAQAMAEQVLASGGSGSKLELPSLASGGVIIAAGSQNPTALRQVAFLKERVAMMRHCVVLHSPPEQREDIADLHGTQHHLLTLPEADPAHLPSETRLNMAGILGKCASELVKQTNSRRLILTGGDTAAATFRCLDVSFLEIIGAVEEAMPLLQVSGGPADGALAVTKAGGFGSEASLYNAFRALTLGINDA